MKNIFIDIHYSFLRQPIKLALSYRLKDKVAFTTNSDEADLIITTSDQTTYADKPVLYLTDNPAILAEQDMAIAISPVPVNDRDMLILVERVAQWCV